MTFKIIIFICFLTSSGVLGKSVRIIGGENTDIKNFPFMVSVRMIPFNKLICGGVIISESHVLSAAHCFYKLKEYYQFIRIYMGTSNMSLSSTGSIFGIEKIFLHYLFTGRKDVMTMNQHDISIIKVKGTITFNEFQKKASLPISNILGGEIGVILGWGLTTYPDGDTSPTLRKAEMHILNNTICQPYFEFIIHSDQVCAYKKIGHGVCTGDSGGPLISDNKIIGIVSMSEPCATGIPDIYTSVYSHLDFIQKTITINHDT